jgi:hypothetical protein
MARISVKIIKVVFKSTVVPFTSKQIPGIKPFRLSSSGDKATPPHDTTILPYIFLTGPIFEQAASAPLLYTVRRLGCFLHRRVAFRMGAIVPYIPALIACSRRFLWR